MTDPGPRPIEPTVNDSGSGSADDQVITAGPERGSIKLIWDTARVLADDPEAIEAMAHAHALGPSGHCRQCRPRAWWPCPPWLVATLAQVPHTSAPQTRSRPRRP